MFIRLRVHQTTGKKKTVAGLRLGTAKTLPRRDSWVALSQERYSIIVDSDCQAFGCLRAHISVSLGELDLDEYLYYYTDV